MCNFLLYEIAKHLYNMQFCFNLETRLIAWYMNENDLFVGSCMSFLSLFDKNTKLEINFLTFLCYLNHRQTTLCSGVVVIEVQKKYRGMLQ